MLFRAPVTAFAAPADCPWVGLVAGITPPTWALGLSPLHPHRSIAREFVRAFGNELLIGQVPFVGADQSPDGKLWASPPIHRRAARIRDAVHAPATELDIKRYLRPDRSRPRERPGPLRGCVGGCAGRPSGHGCLIRSCGRAARAGAGCHPAAATRLISVAPVRFRGEFRHFIQPTAW